MKNLIPLFIAVLFVLSSCKKEQKKTDDPSNPGADKKYQVTFNLTNPELKTEASKTKVNAVTPTNTRYIKFLKYVVFDSQWALVHSFEQDTTTSNFGVIADDFTPGTYHLVFIGTQRGVQGPNKDFFTSSPQYLDDFFSQSITITVTNTNINQDVVLERVAAKLQLVFQDTIPADVAEVKISYGDYTAFLYSVGFAQALPRNYDNYVNMASVVGTVNYTFTKLIYNTITPNTIILTPYTSASPQKYVPDTIRNVIFKKNQVTIVRGKVFKRTNPIGTAGFQITLNPNWDPSVVFPF